MSGLYVYPAIVAGALLALVIWIWLRYDLLPSRQIEIVFFFIGFICWIQMTLELYSSFYFPARISAPQSRRPAVAAMPSDNHMFFKQLFGATKPAGSALAYAAPERDVLDDARRITSGPLLGLDEWTAVYDISAHAVYLPDGAELEAHSGLGARLDDPHYVHERMRGATPPNVYRLALREQPFHGVQALRLIPDGGGNVLGRANLLAHTYMLGPKGESHGCVVFKNYSAFLRAFQDGRVKRLIVVDRIDRALK